MDRPKNKATMDQPQEEFIQPLSSSIDWDETDQEEHPQRELPLAAASESAPANEVGRARLVSV